MVTGMLCNLAVRHLVLSVCAVIVPVTRDSWTSSAPSSQARPQCLEDFWGGARYSCYRPSEQRRAEHQLSFHPFHVTAVVKRFTGLSLVQEIVFKGSEVHPLRRGNGIEYIFGTPSAELVSYPSPPQPKWLLFNEGPLVGGTQPQQNFTITGGERNTQPGPTGTVIPWSNPWTLTGALAQRRMGFLITTNEDRATIEQIASAVVQAASQP